MSTQLTVASPTTLVLRRTFDAPADRVFSAWLNPDVMREFMVPEGCKLIDLAADPRVGGSYRITFDTPNGVMTVNGIYREIVRPQRIVCTWTWEEDTKAEEHETMLTLEFNDLGAKTELVLTHANLRNEESREGHTGGWKSIYDNLALVLERGAA